MTIFRTITLLSAVLAVHLCFAQVEHKRDSLLHLAETSSVDSFKVRMYLDVSKLYHTSKEATPWIDKAMALSIQTGYGLGVANSLTNYNLYLMQQGKHDQVLANSARGIELAKPFKAHKTIGVFYNYIANVHNQRGEHRLALENYLLALDEIKQSDAPPFFELAIEGNIIKLYGDLRQFKKSLELGLASIQKANAKGLKNSAGYIYQSVAIAYKEEDQLKQSRVYWDTCLQVAETIEDAHLTAAALSNLAAIFSDEGNTTKAMDYYRRSIDIAQKNDDREIEMWGLHGLAQEAYFKKQWADAYKLTLQAKLIGEQNKYQEYLTNIYLLLSDIEIGRGRLTEAAEWRSKWFKLRTELTNEDVTHSTKELETRYQTKEKEQQIKLQQLTISRKNNFIWGLSAVLALLVFTGILYYRYARQKQQIANKDKQLQEQLIRQLDQEKQLSAANGVLQGQEEERGRLARDIHDGLGGMLSGVKSTLTAMKQEQFINEDSAASFSKVLNALDNSIAELRRVARNLMPEALIHFGLKDALRDYCGNLSETGKFHIEFQAYGLEERLPQQTEIIVFRIIQELLNNIQKHAGATQAIVQLVRDHDRLHITVEDNGKGFDMNATDLKKGVGLLSIRSRVAYLNGEIDISSTPGKGTMVTIECKLQS